MSNKKSLSKRLILPVTILLGGALAITGVMFTKATPTANPDLLTEPPKTKARVQKAVTQTATLSAKSQGTVQPKNQVDIAAQVSGKIIKVSPLFVNGSFADENALLLEIDDRDHQAALITAKSRVAQTQRLLAEEKGRSRQAKREWRDLGNKEANDLFLRKPQLIEAQAAVESAKASLRVAELNIERTKITVPFNARITETHVNLGQFVNAGTKLVSVYDTSIAEVRLPLSDKQMALLDLPVSNLTLTNQPLVTLTGTIAGKRYQWLGKIKRTESSVDIRTRMYHAIAEIEQPFSNNQEAPLLPGLFVEAEIEGKQLSDVVVLPKEVLVKRTNLYTLDKDNKVQLSPVNVLRKQANKVWIQTQLTDDTDILLEKHAVVVPGVEVEPIHANQSSDVEATDIAVAQTTEQ